MVLPRTRLFQFPAFQMARDLLASGELFVHSFLSSSFSFSCTTPPKPPKGDLPLGLVPGVTLPRGDDFPLKLEPGVALPGETEAAAPTKRVSLFAGATFCLNLGGTPVVLGFLGGTLGGGALVTDWTFLF